MEMINMWKDIVKIHPTDEMVLRTVSRLTHKLNNLNYESNQVESVLHHLAEESEKLQANNPTNEVNELVDAIQDKLSVVQGRMDGVKESQWND